MCTGRNKFVYFISEIRDSTSHSLVCVALTETIMAMRELEKQKKADLRHQHLAAVQPFINAVKESVRKYISESSALYSSDLLNCVIVDDFGTLTGEQVTAAKAILENDEGLFIDDTVYGVHREDWTVYWEK
jgi:pantothenate kinase type III